MQTIPIFHDRPNHGPFNTTDPKAMANVWTPYEQYPSSWEEAINIKEMLDEAIGCLRCGMPGCSQPGVFTDKLWQPAGCELGRPIPVIHEHIRAGRYDDALFAELENNPFLYWLGAACEALCKLGCNTNDPHSAIRHPTVEFALSLLLKLKLERGDYIPLPLPAEKDAPKVAIVGAGLAGLTAAWEIAKAQGLESFREKFPLGIQPVVFDSQPLIGGMCLDGIPPMHIPPIKETNQRPVSASVFTQKLLEKSGIQFQPETWLDKSMATNSGGKLELNLGDKTETYEAVVMAIGARKLKMTGLNMDENCPLFMNPLDFLKPGIYGFYGIQGTEMPDLKGKKIVIIGAGYTARDCASMARRLGAEEVHVIIRKPEPGEENQLWLVSADARHEMARLAKAEGITLHWEHELVSVEVSSVLIKGNSGSIIELTDITYVIPSLGFNTQGESAIEDTLGFLPDISFATGDMVDGNPQTLVNAAGHAKRGTKGVIEQLLSQAI